MINENGGYCMTTLNPLKVTHVLCNKNNSYKGNAKYKIAHENELPIYDEKWLFEVIKNKKLPTDKSKYLIEGKLNAEESK